MKKLLAIILCVLLVLSFAACGSSGTATDPGSSGGAASGGSTGGAASGGSSGGTTSGGSSGGAASGGSSGGAAAVRDSIVIGTESDCGSLDPYVITGAGFFPVWICYAEPLWVFDGSGDNGFASRYILAESVDIISDQEYIIHLQKGVTFSNGNPFTAEDVLYTWRTVHDNPSRFYYIDVIDLDNSVADDDYTVHLYLTRFDKTQLAVLQDVPILDAESYDPDSYGMNPVGTGPYVVTNYIVNNTVELEARDDYWGGAPQIKHVTFKNIPEDSQKVTAIQTGEVDALVTCPNADAAFVDSLDGVSTVKKTSIQAITMYFNCNAAGVLGTKEARQAVAYATNKEAVVNLALEGNGSPAKCIFAAGCSDYYDKLGTLNDTYATGYNLELAKKYAEESGLVGQTVRIITNGATEYVTTAQIVEQALKEIGVNAEVKNYDQATVADMVWGLDGWDIYVNYSANPSGLGGDIIYGNVWKFDQDKVSTDPEAYDIFGDYGQKILALSNRDEYNKILEEYIIYAEDYCPFVAVANRELVCAARDEVHGFGYYAFSYLRVADWHFD